jgi:hypothetical protein
LTSSTGYLLIMLLYIESLHGLQLRASSVETFAWIASQAFIAFSADDHLLPSTPTATPAPQTLATYPLVMN